MPSGLFRATFTKCLSLVAVAKGISPHYAHTLWEVFNLAHVAVSPRLTVRNVTVQGFKPVQAELS